MTDLPAEVALGKITGLFLVAVTDSDDPDAEPDAQPESGTIKFLPQLATQRVMAPELVTIINKGVICTLNAEGRLVDSQGAVGIWLITGAYDVTFTLKNSKILPLTVVVTEDHTELTPLDLALAIPPPGPVLNQGQYAELSSRMEAVELAASPPVHGTLPGLDADDHVHYALADGTRGSFATTAQGAKADTAVQPDALAAYATDAELAAGLTSVTVTDQHVRDVIIAALEDSPSIDVTSYDPTSISIRTVGGYVGEWASWQYYWVTDTVLRSGKFYRALTTGVLGQDPLTQADDWVELLLAYATPGQGALAASASQPGHGHTASNISDSTPTGRALLTAADASAARTSLVLGSAATTDSSAYATAAQGTLAGTASQPGHGHTASAVSDSTATGRALLTAADASAARTTLVLGTAATTDASAYATAAQGTLAGTASQPGHGHAASDTTSGIFSPARLGTGTADATTFLRGDGAYAVPAGGGSDPWTYEVSTTETANSTVTPTNIAGVSIPALPDGLYVWNAMILCRTAATAIGAHLGITIAGATGVVLHGFIIGSGTTAAYGNGGTSIQALSGGGPAVNSTYVGADMNGVFRATSMTGTIDVTIDTETAATEVKAMPDSFIKYRRIAD